MKIVCVGRNYAEHARELGNEVPEEPVLFIKPETALLSEGSPFRLPTFSNDVHHEIELVLQISREASQVSEEEAPNFYRQMALGLDFTARDLQSKCKTKGLPWEIAKAFDGSAAVGEFFPVESGEIDFSLRKNGAIVQRGSSRDMIHSCASVVSYASRYFRLLPGDLVFTGTPSGVGPVRAGDKLQGFLREGLVLECDVVGPEAS